MAKNFRQLLRKMSSRAQQRIDERVRKTIAEEDIARIREQPGVAINKAREQEIGCCGCGKKLGFATFQVMAPPEGSFAFRSRFACYDCGQKIATLSLLTPEGEVH